MAAPNMKQPLGRFRNVAGDRVHPGLAMAADSGMVGQNCLHSRYINLPPPLPDEQTHPLQAGTGIGQRVGFILGDSALSRAATENHTAHWQSGSGQAHSCRNNPVVRQR